MLDLPPPYTLIALGEAGSAFAHACAIAVSDGAGTLVWAPRGDVLDVAVVLEPVENLAVARQVVFAGLNAAADALAVDCPPEKPISCVWPDALMFDGGLVGGVRLAWAASGEEDVPDWLVLGLMLRVRADGPVTALVDEGFVDFEAGAFIESFARHLMVALDEWQARGPGAVFARFCQRCDDAGDPADLAGILAAPSWLDGEIKV